MLIAPRLVGRADELAELRQALSRGLALVTIEGDAGIGKSRLLHELLACDDALRTGTLLATCPPFREPHTLGPLVDALHATREHIGEIREPPLSPLAGALLPLFPEWSAQLPPAPEPLDDASAVRHRLYRALAELLDRLGVTLLALEDMHWADSTTQDFLLFLATRPTRPISLLLTYRPQDLPPDSRLPVLLSRLPPGMELRRLHLEPLSPMQVNDMVSSMLSDAQVTAAFADFLVEHTDGVPLAVEHAVRLLGDRTDLIKRDGAWVRRNLGVIDVPSSIRAAVLERVRRAPPDARQVLEAAAVLGEPTHQSAVADTAGLPADRADAALAEAADLGMLRRDRATVAFQHALPARAVYESLAASRRRELHGRAGRALETTTAPAARLARHFREAGDTATWAVHAERAADQARASGDPVTSNTIVHELITTADLPPITVARLAGEMEMRSGITDKLHQQVRERLRATLEAGGLEPAAEVALRTRLGHSLLRAEEVFAGRLELERALPLLDNDPATARSVMTWLASPRGIDIPAAEHLRWLRRASELDHPMSADVELAFRFNRGTSLLMMGRREGWDDFAYVTRQVGGTPRLRNYTADAHMNAADAALRWGRYGAARRHLACGQEIYGAQRFFRHESRVTELHLDWRTGAWDGIADRAADLSDAEIIAPLARLEAVLVRGMLAAATGHHEEAQSMLRMVIDKTGRHGAYDCWPEPANALARLYLDDDDPGRALDITDEPIRVVRGKDIWIWAIPFAAARTDALLAAGRHDEAAALVTELDHGTREQDIPRAEPTLLYCRAALAASRDAAQASDLFGAAAEAWLKLPQPYDALLARERQADCLLRVDRAKAVRLLQAALVELNALGATAAARRVAATLRRHGVAARGPRRGGRQGYGDRLSPRELDVARLLVEGKTNRAIATELVLSPKTVGHHLDSAMRKLEVQTRTALAVRLLESGVLRPPAELEPEAHPAAPHIGAV